MSAAKRTSDLWFRKFAGFSTRSVALELFVPRGSVMRMTGDCAGVVDASPESFEGRTIPHSGVWKGRDSIREYGLFSQLVQNAQWRCELWQDKCQMGCVPWIFMDLGRQSREKPNQRAVMSHVFVTLIAASMVLCASAAVTQSARDVRGPSPLIAIENEAAPKLIVDPPLPEPLSRGLVFIQYRTENLRIAPVFGKGALEVSPRVGHVHVTVDDVGWHFVDASGETLIVVGLKPGPHKVLIELADPTHRVITSERVKFTLPSPKSPDSR